MPLGSFGLRGGDTEGAEGEHDTERDDVSARMQASEE